VHGSEYIAHYSESDTTESILIGTNIGLVNMNSCNFSKIIQDDTNNMGYGKKL